MKVLLYYPNWYNINWIPLGVSILYTRLKEKGIIVELFDTTFYNLIGSGNKSDRSMLRESDLQKGIKQGQYMESNFENFYNHNLYIKLATKLQLKDSFYILF